MGGKRFARNGCNPRRDTFRETFPSATRHACYFESLLHNYYGTTLVPLRPIIFYGAGLAKPKPVEGVVMRAAASRPAAMAATRSTLAAPPARRGRPTTTACAAAAPPNPTAPPARAARLSETRARSWSVSTAQGADWPRRTGAWGSPRHDLARATPARGARDYPSCDWLDLTRLFDMEARPGLRPFP